MFYQIYILPQVKQCTIITYKPGICELPRELPNDLRLWKTSGSQEIRTDQKNFKAS